MLDGLMLRFLAGSARFSSTAVFGIDTTAPLDVEHLSPERNSGTRNSNGMLCAICASDVTFEAKAGERSSFGNAKCETRRRY